jgi:tripartite-type tricarboxylate transporter receptor subunit TctC
MKRRDLLISSLAVPAMAMPLHAQSDKPLRLMVGFPAGGSIDTVARTLADKMKDDLRQPVIVENKPGAGGRLVAELLKNAPPDGSTVMITPVVVPVLAPLVFSKLNYNPATDFQFCAVGQG